jgi:Spy/CpxP family protein refolding chaperone
MKNRILSILTVLAIVISSVAVAQKAPRSNRNQTGNEKMMKHEMKPRSEKLAFLSDEQKETAKALHLETAKQVKPLKNELRELQAHQQTLTTAEKTDLNAIYKNIDKISEVKSSIAKIMAKQKQEFRAMLSEEQLLKFDGKMEKGRGGERGELHRSRMNRKDAPMNKRGA